MKSFKRQKVENPTDFLSAALSGEQYVRASLEKHADGLRSTAGNGAEKDNLYSGTAGILHMYMILDWILQNDIGEDQVSEVADIGSEETGLGELVGGKDGIISGLTRYMGMHALDQISIADEIGERFPGSSRGFYSGIAGTGMILNEVWRRKGDLFAREGVNAILNWYADHAVQAADGIYWTDNAQIYYDSGVILFLLDAVEAESAFNLVPLIREAADHILAHAISHPGGGLEIEHTNIAFTRGEPNYELGTAGNGFMFARVYEVTRDEKYLEAAKACAVYLTQIAAPSFLIPYKPAVFPGLFYLGHCHGPVGTAKLFYQLVLLTGRKEYAEDCRKLCFAAESLGVPLHQSPGFWNTTCVCCGPAGWIPLYLGMQRLEAQVGFGSLGKDVVSEKFARTMQSEISSKGISGSKLGKISVPEKDLVRHWQEQAHLTGEILVGEKTGNLASWPIAFDRTAPEVITAPAGFFPGAAGIVSVLLHLYASETGEQCPIHLADDPYFPTV